MVFALVGLCILVYSFVDFKKSFILYLTYKLFLVTNITLISLPGIPLLTVEMFLTLMYILLFVSKHNKYQFAHTKFLFRAPFLLLVISWTLSALFALAGFKAEITFLIKTISEEVLLIWMMWETLETKEDYARLYKSITIVVFISCVYGLVEYIIQSNPLVMYEATLIQDESKMFLGQYSTEGRGYRIQSIFEHPIGAGINWSIYSVFTFWLWINQKDKVKLKKLALLTAFLCIPCVILTKMRSPLLFYMIAALSLVNFKKKRLYVLALCGIGALVVLFPLIKDNFVILASMFNENAAEKVSGSSFEMRILQMKQALQLLKMSPLTGLGVKFAQVLPKEVYVMLYGMESVWLSVTVQYGSLGILAYIVFMIYSIVIVPYRCKSNPLMFFALAYWVTYTASSLPGLKISLYFMVVFYFIKTSRYYRKAAETGKVYGCYLDHAKLKFGRIK